MDVEERPAQGLHQGAGLPGRTWSIAPADAPERTVTVRHYTLTEALQEARDRHFGEDVRLVAEEVF